MSDILTILFYDGYSARPKECRLELMPGNRLCVFDMEQQEPNGFIFSAANCHISSLGTRTFVHLEKNGGPYFEIWPTNPLFFELTQLINNSSAGFFQKLTRQKWPVLMGILGILVVAIWLLVTVALPPFIVKWIPVKQEINLGNRIYASFMLGKEEDIAASQLVQRFADRLQLSRKYPVRISVVKEDEVNAFALPGGQIVVYSPILDILKTPEQLAALLGHEATHVNERHTLRMLVSVAGRNMVQSIVLGGFGNVGDMVIGNVNELTQRRYSRSLERQADKEGMELMLAHHLDPAGMKGLMQQLQKEDRDVPGVLSFMSTHPLTTERIKSADQFIEDHKSGTFAPDVPLNTLWKALKSLHEAKTSTPRHTALP